MAAAWRGMRILLLLLGRTMRRFYEQVGCRLLCFARDYVVGKSCKATYIEEGSVGCKSANG